MQCVVLVAAVPLQAIEHPANQWSRGGQSTRDAFLAACRDGNGRWILGKAGVVRWYHKALRNIFVHAFGEEQRIFLEEYPPELLMFNENGRLSQALMSG